MCRQHSASARLARYRSNCAISVASHDARSIKNRRLAAIAAGAPIIITNQNAAILVRRNIIEIGQVTPGIGAAAAQESTALHWHRRRNVGGGPLGSSVESVG